MFFFQIMTRILLEHQRIIIIDTNIFQYDCARKKSLINSVGLGGGFSQCGDRMPLISTMKDERLGLVDNSRLYFFKKSMTCDALTD